MSLRFNLFPLMSPEPPPTSGGTVSGGATTTPDMDKEEVIEFLGEEEEKEVLPLDTKTKEPKETKEEESDEEKEEKEEEEVDELDELEKELQEPTEEDLELVTPVRRSEIIKKFPIWKEIVKEFPYLEKAYYREQQFTEILPTIDDAKEAVAAKNTLDRFQNELLGGNTETILKAVKSENPEGFNKIVDEYLTTLAKVDEPAYYHVLGNVTKHTIIAMINEARSSKNEALQSAAQILNQFVFGSSDFKPPTKLAKEGKGGEEDTTVTESQKREQILVKRHFESSRDDLNNRVNNTLKNTIDAHIDPKKSMTDYVRRNASREALETLESLITRDTRFRSILDKLWERAFNDNFSRNSLDSIKSAYLSKAKTLLPTVIKKARNEAMRGSGKRVSESDDDKTPNRGPIPSGRPRSTEPGKSGKVTKAEDIPKGMRTIDFLMQD